MANRIARGRSEVQAGRTDLRIGLSGAKFDAGVDFEIHLAVAPPKHSQIVKKRARIYGVVRVKTESWSNWLRFGPFRSVSIRFDPFRFDERCGHPFRSDERR